jgi:lipopolysaccharide biosynthesis glycosyltransferase
MAEAEQSQRVADKDDSSRLILGVERQQVLRIPQHKSAQQKDTTATDTANENILIVIISNRKDGIIPTIGSILATASKPVDVVLIGVHETNEQVRTHFGDRINDFTSLSVQDVSDDLLKQGRKPIWTWDTWHTSINNPAWRTEHTLHVGPWDDLETHAHELNHIRFYLPFLSIFQDKEYFYFLDDDILIRKDLGVLATQTLADLDSNKGLVSPCNIWMWNSDCFRFEFQSQQDFILDMPSLYGDREVCKTDSESHCVPETYWDFVDRMMPKGGKEQHAWNFGFSLFALDNWRSLQLTEKYEAVMKESYRLHVFPETSLTFGLGVAYIAFAGAVQCWNENYVKVRDGFGFIEWDRFEDTFGKDFFENQVDICHYTGPDKPWVKNSRIEQRAIEPWLNIMEREMMPVPAQLPVEPTNNLFTVLASESTGVSYIMSTLDSHPKVCASGESDKPETGFPADSLHPDGLDWFPKCSTKKGCTFAFVNESVSQLKAEMADDGVTPRRCAHGYDPVSNDDPLKNHLPRLCNVISMLKGNVTGGALEHIWVDAFVAEDKSLLGCGCTRGTKAKGLKVLPEWIAHSDGPLSAPKLNLNDTRVHGSKVIRLKRRNLWARYKSMMTAETTQIFHPTSPAEKKTQLDALKSAGNLTVDMHHLEWHMAHMKEIDRLGDEWARDHASDILWIDYEDCTEDTTSCFERIYSFIGVDKPRISNNKEDHYASMFDSFGDVDDSLEYIVNAAEVRETMGVHGWDGFIAEERHTPIQLLLYTDDEMLMNTRQYLGINATVFGGDRQAKGYGSKFSAVIPLLKEMTPETMVVLGDNQGAWVNFPPGDHEVKIAALYDFRVSFQDLTRDYPNAVVVSAETQCCASALTHVAPGDLFSSDGKRNGRSCLSGEPKCEWKGDESALPWQRFMTELAGKRSSQPSARSFLDAGLTAGKAGDLLKLLETADIGETEDDRAVLTDLMYRNPAMILLDYDQRLLGEHGLHTSQNACFADTIDVTVDKRRLEHYEKSPNSLFMRSPRGLGCDSNREVRSPSYPSWNEDGIALKPILDHIERVTAMKEIIVLPPKYGRAGNELEYPQGPEVPYIVDDQGIWTSRLVRDRTNNETFFWRLLPTEGLILRAHKLLISEAVETPRWNALKRSVRTGGVPYWSWYGDFKACNFHNRDNESIPIFTTCAKVDCDHAFPVPNYFTESNTQVSDDNWRGFFRENEEKYPWATKIKKVGWRGALSESDSEKALTSIRWRVAKLVHEMRSDLYDVGLTDIPTWLTSQMEFDLSLVGGLVKGIQPMTAFQRYAAVLDMDGNSWSSRFGPLLCYNSVVIKIEPKYVEYFYGEVKPWVHFIPVKDDLSDLHENVAWALDPENEAAVKDIINAANQWCSHRFLPDELARDMVDIWESYVRKLDRGDPNWQATWNRKREQISSPSSDFDLFQLP